MAKLLLASNNPGKVLEYKSLFYDEVYNLDEETVSTRAKVSSE